MSFCSVQQERQKFRLKVCMNRRDMTLGCFWQRFQTKVGRGVVSTGCYWSWENMVQLDRCLGRGRQCNWWQRWRHWIAGAESRRQTKILIFVRWRQQTYHTQTFEYLVMIIFSTLCKCKMIKASSFACTDCFFMTVTVYIAKIKLLLRLL